MNKEKVQEIRKIVFEEIDKQKTQYSALNIAINVTYQEAQKEFEKMIDEWLEGSNFPETFLEENDKVFTLKDLINLRKGILKELKSKLKQSGGEA